MRSELEEIPGIGKSIARDLQQIGINRITDLQDKDPEKLYKKLCEVYNKHIDRCMLYVFRCAVYYASHMTHEPEKLKWWNWKDKKQEN